jgi:hypothetical protein
MSVDAIVLGLLAIGDLLLIGYLRFRRSEEASKERLMRSLVFAVRRENGEIPAAEPQRRLAGLTQPLSQSTVQDSAA